MLLVLTAFLTAGLVVAVWKLNRPGARRLLSGCNKRTTYACDRVKVERPRKEILPSSNKRTEAMQKEKIGPFLWGAGISAIVTTIATFATYGMTDDNAKLLAKETADAAVITALVPFCVLNFQGQPDAPDRLIELKAVTSSYQQGRLLEEAGWATMPGGEKPNADVARACATELIKTVS